MNVISVIRFSYTIFTVIFVYFGNFLLVKKLENLIRQIIKIRSEKNFKFSLALLGGFLSAYLSVTFFACGKVIAWGKISKLHSFFNFFAFMPIHMQTLFCVAMTLKIKYGFRDFNKKLVENFKSFDKNFQTQQISIVKLIKTFNEVFSFHIAIYTGYNLINQLLTLFIFYLATLKNEETLYTQTLVLFMWDFVTVSLTILSIVSCCLVNNETEKCEKILHEKLLSESNPKRRKKLKIFFLQFQQTRAKFSCGLFEFDWKVLAMVRLNKAWTAQTNELFFMLKFYSDPQIFFKKFISGSCCLSLELECNFFNLTIYFSISVHWSQI
jgi:hypothetical protein